MKRSIAVIGMLLVCAFSAWLLVFCPLLQAQNTGGGGNNPGGGGNDPVVSIPSINFTPTCGADGKSASIFMSMVRTYTKTEDPDAVIGTHRSSLTHCFGMSFTTT